MMVPAGGQGPAADGQQHDRSDRGQQDAEPH
jgi:hypothetical protein